MPLPAEIREIECTERRGAVRRTLRLTVDSQLSVGAVEAVIRDLSEQGLLLETTTDLMLGERLHIELPEAGTRAAAVVWNRGNLFGCEFSIPLTKRIVSATLLLAPNDRSVDAGAFASGRALDQDGYQTESDNSILFVLAISVAVLLLAALVFLSALFQAH